MTTDLPKIVRVTIQGTYDGEPWVNVLHFSWDGAGDPAGTDISTLLGLLGSATTNPQSFGSLIRQMDINVAMTSLTGRTLSTTAPLERTLSVALTGNRVGNNLPPMMACLIKWNGAFALRTSRGRTYLTGVNDNMLNTSDSDQFSTASLSDVSTAATAFLNYWFVTNTSWSFIVLSRKQREANVAAPFDIVNSFEVEPRMCIQRRRRQPPS